MAGRPSKGYEIVKSWVTSNKEVISLLKKEKISNIYDNEFSEFLEENDLVLSKGAFAKYAKQIASEKGFKNINSNKNVKSVVEKEDKISWKEKFNMVKAYSKLVEMGSINSLCVYGTPGSGKDFEVEKALEGNSNVEYFRGAMKGVHELASVLYENRKDKILVFSDFDSVFKTTELLNLLKVALEDKDERYITWTDNSKRTKKTTLPNKFKFTSGIIFISNLKRFDSALKSRSKNVKIDMSKEEILEKISENLGTFMTKIPMELKKEVLDFIIKNKDKITHIDFRQFKFAVADRIIFYEKNPKDNGWKEWVLHSLNS